MSVATAFKRDYVGSITSVVRYLHRFYQYNFLIANPLFSWYNIVINHKDEKYVLLRGIYYV